MGVFGAVAEFTATDDADVQVHTEGDGITAYTQNGAIRMTIDDDVRALTFDPPGLMREPRIVLAVKRERGRLPVADVVTDLNPDSGALLQEDSARIYDLGLGRKEGRFCVRLLAGQAKTALHGAEGMEFGQALPMIGGALVAESPTRIVESMLG